MRTTRQPGTYRATHKKVEYEIILNADGTIALTRPRPESFRNLTELDHALFTSARGWAQWTPIDVATTGEATVPKTTRAPRGLRVTKALKAKLAEHATPTEGEEPAPKPVKPVGPRIINIIKRARKLPAGYDRFPTKPVGPSEELFVCIDCLTTFVAPKGRIPETCPAGHAAKAIDDFADVPAGDE